MRALYITIILLIGESNYMDFLKSFPNFGYDENGNFLTRELSSMDYSDLSENYLLISDNNSFNYLCDKDSSHFFYQYDLYNMDEDRYTGFVREKYKHYAISAHRKEQYDIALFSKFDDKNERFVLRSFTKSGSKVDELVVNDYKYEGTGAAPEFFRFSLIGNDSVKVLTYYSSQASNNENRKEHSATTVIMEDFAIDSLGSFKRISEKKFLLSGALTKYSKFSNEPEVDDPIYKYWTLW